MSLYNRSNSFVERVQMQAVQQNWLRSVDNLLPVPEENGGATEAVSPSKNLPDFKVPSDLLPVSKDNIEAFKMQ
jgi:hypothetical protein